MLHWNKEADRSVKPLLAVNMILLYFGSVGMGSTNGGAPIFSTIIKSLILVFQRCICPCP